MEQAMVEQVRRFNRAATQQAGALDDGFLGRRRSLGASRVLWEIGPEGCEVGDLRARLGLDSGYLSRLLRSLETEGLVSVGRSAADGRRRVAALTPAGRAERGELDERSEERARAVLRSLAPSQRERLVGAMAEVERLLAAAAIELRPVDPEHADAQRCLAAYFAELEARSGSTFDPESGETAAPHELRPPAGLMVVAYRGLEAIGCGAVKHHPSGASHIKRVWVAPSARGLGLGRRLLEALEAEAVRSGATVAQLDTHRTLHEARALYLSAGYVEVPRFNAETFADFWFEKRLPASSG